MERMPEIIEKYGAEYVLRQLAEECAELAQAALKLIRAQRKETPMRMDEATERFIEEMADVKIMWDGVYNSFISDEGRGLLEEMKALKTIRMYDRMLDGNMDELMW